MTDRPDLPELMERRGRANIVPGYKLKKNNTPQLPYKFIAEINVDNPELWKLFTALCALMPASCCVEYGLYGEEPVTTHYFDTSVILQKLSIFEKELSQDGFLSFGLRSLSKGELNEIMVTESKYIQFWYSDLEGFKMVMQQFKLKEFPDLAFIDEYPKIIEPLNKFMNLAKKPAEVIRQLNIAFGVQH
jgi:hypothetical protein